MPASPIIKSNVVLSRCNSENPHLYDHLEKVIVPDQATGCYWSVWFNQYKEYMGTMHLDAWLMWCPFDENGVDNGGHVEELTIELTDVLNTIEMVFDISFHDRIIKPIYCKDCGKSEYIHINGTGSTSCNTFKLPSE